MVCFSLRGDSARERKDRTSGPKVILLSLRILLSAMGEGRRVVGVSDIDDGEELTDESAEGT